MTYYFDVISAESSKCNYNFPSLCTPLCLDSLEVRLYLINKIEACLTQPRKDICGKNGNAFHLLHISVELKEVCLHNNLLLSKGLTHNYKKILLDKPRNPNQEIARSAMKSPFL